MYHKATIHSLTGCRFFAAFAVMLMHYHSTLPFPDLVAPLASSGGMGVVFFFILSGFVLAWNYHSEFSADNIQWRSYLHFGWRRFARLYPLYALALLLVTVAYFFDGFGLAASSRPEGPHLWRSWLANLSAIQVWIPSNDYQQFWNAPGWSVSAEIFFYSIFPVSIRLFSKHRDPLRLAGLIVLAGCLCILMLSAAVFYWGDRNSTVQVTLLQRVPLLNCWVFLFGVALCFAFLKRPRPETPSGLSGARLLLVLGGLLLVPYLLQELVLHRPATTSFWAWTLSTFSCYYLFTPLFGALIWQLVRNEHMVSRLLGTRWALLLGESSYALYITHWIPLMFFTRYGLLSAHPVAWLCFAMAGSVILSVGLHLAFETPLRKLLTARLAN